MVLSTAVMASGLLHVTGTDSASVVRAPLVSNVTC
jgi:hypothetical protein